MRRIRRAGSLLVLVLLGVTAGCSSDGALDSPAVGSVVRLGPSDDRPGPASMLALPVGDLAVHLDTDTQRLPERVVDRDGVASRPAEGSSFATVSWQLSRAAGEPIVDPPTWEDDPPELTVVGADGDHDLGPMELLGDPRVVTVGGSAADVTLRLTYDGRTFALDPSAGLVDPQPDFGAAADVACPAIPEAPSADATVPSFSGASCALATASTDWVPGLGWAGEGRRFSVVRMTIDGRPYIDAGGTDYDVTIEEPRLTLDGAPPVAVLDRDGNAVAVSETPADQAGASIGRLLVFDVGTGAADQQLVGSWTYRGDAPASAPQGAPARSRRSFDVDVVLPAA